MRRCVALLILIALVMTGGVVFSLLPQVGEARTTGPEAVKGMTWRAFRAQPTTPLAGPNIVLICIDTLRADHMSLYGYARPTTPAIDAFAEEARVFDRAYATAPFTTPSVVSMLSGLYPYRHGVRLLWQKIDDHTITVADRLGRAGYRTAAVISNLVLTDAATGLAARFDHYDEAVDEPEPNRPEMLERRASRTTDAAIAWLDEHAGKASAPFFLWVHYIDPHGPYQPPEDAPARFTHDEPAPIDPATIAEYVRDPDITDGRTYIDRYDEEIAYADREVGRLLAAVERLTGRADTLIVITADHGEYLLDREDYRFCHGYGVDRAVTHIPLVVRHPSIPAGREEAPVSIADVAPTLLEVAGATLPADLDGRSLRGSISARPPYIEGPDPQGSGGLERAYVYSQRKIVVRHGLSNEPRERWAFDLAADLGETKPLAVDTAEPAYWLLAELIRSEPDPGGRPAAHVQSDKRGGLVSEQLTDDELDKLRSLGYVN